MIALSMIVKGTKDEAPYLEKCLESVHEHVNGIFLNVNHPNKTPDQEVLDVANKYATQVIITRWEDHFGKARSANKIPKYYDWILWLDSDDTIVNPEKISEVAEKAKSQNSIYAYYDYDHDEHGNVITSHLVARLYRNNGSHEWKGRIHETLVETRAGQQGMTEDFRVVHNAREERRDASLVRNIVLLEKQLEEESESGEGIDPRTMFYLAGSYIDAGQDNRAKELYETYVTVSGWDEERSQAYAHLGRIAKRENDNANAKQHFLTAIGEAPADIEPYIELGQLEMELGNNGKAVFWLNMALSLKEEPTTLVKNPTSRTYRVHMLLAQSYVNLGGSRLEKALEHAEIASKAIPDSTTITFKKAIKRAISDKSKLEKVLHDIRESKGDIDKVKNILKSVPKSIEDNPAIVALKSKNLPMEWPKKSIAIYTGETAIENWGPWSLKDGIGGSEEAIIRIAPHLRDLGYKVVIFANPGTKAGEYDGIQWRNHWECKLDDKFDVFIAWRNPYLFDRSIKARKTYLWLHDVMDRGEFTPERLNNVDKVMLLSKYHRTCYPEIPDEKVLYSGNGIDPEEFKELDGVERDPHKIIYQSSHVRGLENLYKIWPKVIEKVPDATLHVQYGWDSYDKINAGNPERMEWKDKMVKYAKELKGVTEYGKVGQDVVTETASSAGIWAYPTEFPEIYCITAVKAQAGGAVPVCSDYAALDEMVQWGEKMSFNSKRDLDKFADRLIWWLKHPEEQDKIRKQMKKYARKLSWENTARGWDEDFNK